MNAPVPTTDTSAEAGRVASAAPPRTGSEPTTVGFVVGPMNFVQKLDGAFGFLRLELSAMLLGAVVLVLPPSLLAQVVARQATMFTVLSADLNNDPTGTGVGSGWSALGSVAASLWLSLGTLALGIYAGLLLRARLAGEPVSVRMLLDGTLRRLGGGAGAWALHLVALGFGLLACGVGVLVPMTLLLVIGPVIGVEDAGFRGFTRSASLTQTRFFAILGVVVASTLLTALLSAVPPNVVDLIVELLAGTTLPTGWEWIPKAAAGLLATAAASTVAVSIALTTYVDLRCRREGWDLLSRMADEFPPPNGTAS
ncbi:MAG: hypothetical protein WAX12_03880 [Candidatus Microthrix subdominans]|uniref:hypothetical protein n=1 Tax=Candidatus Neomicrothrix sp. TaxID=2719034 RepID=UPI0025920803|nr:hypothetical protein [Candidatus Microthrix sp.]MBK6310625.1 hypothetical protein [Candidatus Microthrix sp.]HMS47246.1 hypothetical protein [Candidatus Microthrix sp.]